MKKFFTSFASKVIFIILLSSLTASKLFASNVSGNQSGNWTITGSPYILTGNVTVPAGQILVIDPGVEVQFPTSGSQLTVQGTLTAKGTAANYIRFTGGNFPFGATRGPISFEAISQNSVMQYVTVDALGYYGAGDLNPAIFVRTSSCSITNCNLQNIGGSAIQILNVTPVVSNNVFTSNAYMDVLMDLDKVKLLTGNNALKIGLTANAAMADNDTLTASNVYYRMEASQTIPQSRSLTINPGVEVQFPTSGSQLTVQGTLTAKGTAANYIRFTGGNFPFGATRGPISFEAISQNSVMQYVTVDALGYYGAGDLNPAIFVRTSSCSITNCNLQNIGGSAIQILNVTPVVSNNVFTSNAYMDVLVDLDKVKLLTGNNALKIGLTANAAMADNDTLTASNVYYRMEASQTIPQSRSLTINPGVEVQFPTSGSQLTVQGTLTAKGTAANYIRFTGGNFPFGATRGPISFEAISQNSVMQYVTVDALGYYGAGDLNPAIFVRTSSCSITNCNLQNIGGSAIQILNVTPVVSNNVFTSNAYMDVLVDLDKVKLLTGNNALKIGLTANAAMADNDTLTASNVYYRMEASQTIPQSRSLTINPGVEVQFPTSGSQLTVQGTLTAKGTAANYIRFTGGNFPFGATRGPISFEAISQNSVMQYVTVDGLGYYGGNSTSPIIIIKNGSTQINNCIVQNSAGVAIGIQNSSSPIITRSCFYNNTSGAVLSTGGKARFVNCNFVGNTSFGINNTSTADTVDARNCWWGNASGPKQTTTNPTGTGDLVSARVLFSPWSTTQFDCSVSELPLPLRLNDFEVTLSSNRAICIWQVTSEINTSHFIIQRSVDGNTYSDIGKVSATGSGNGNTTYQFYDNVPLNGINYYRLKMFDKDGSYTYSKVLRININNASSFVIYPNPVNNDLYLQLLSSRSEKVTWQIVDMQGKILQQRIYQKQTGMATLSFNTSSLAKGAYILVEKGQKIEKKIFIKE